MKTTYEHQEYTVRHVKEENVVQGIVNAQIKGSLWTFAAAIAIPMVIVLAYIIYATF